eukprot:scaffold16.g114.t1
MALEDLLRPAPPADAATARRDNKHNKPKAKDGSRSSKLHYAWQRDLAGLLVRFLLRVHAGAPAGLATLKEVWRQLHFSQIFEASTPTLPLDHCIELLYAAAADRLLAPLPQAVVEEVVQEVETQQRREAQEEEAQQLRRESLRQQEQQQEEVQQQQQQGQQQQQRQRDEEAALDLEGLLPLSPPAAAGRQHGEGGPFQLPATGRGVAELDVALAELLEAGAGEVAGDSIAALGVAGGGPAATAALAAAAAEGLEAAGLGGGLGDAAADALLAGVAADRAAAAAVLAASGPSAAAAQRAEAAPAAAVEPRAATERAAAAAVSAHDAELEALLLGEHGPTSPSKQRAPPGAERLAPQQAHAAPVAALVAAAEAAARAAAAAAASQAGGAWPVKYLRGASAASHARKLAQQAAVAAQRHAPEQLAHEHLLQQLASHSLELQAGAVLVLHALYFAQPGLEATTLIAQAQVPQKRPSTDGGAQARPTSPRQGAATAAGTETKTKAKVKIYLSTQHQEALLALLPRLQAAGLRDAAAAARALWAARAFALGCSRKPAALPAEAAGGPERLAGMGLANLGGNAGLRLEELAAEREVRFHLASTLPGLGTAYLAPLYQEYEASREQLWALLGEGGQRPESIADLRLGALLHELVELKHIHASPISVGSRINCVMSLYKRGRLRVAAPGSRKPRGTEAPGGAAPGGAAPAGAEPGARRRVVRFSAEEAQTWQHLMAGGGRGEPPPPVRLPAPQPDVAPGAAAAEQWKPPEGSWDEDMPELEGLPSLPSGWGTSAPVAALRPRDYTPGPTDAHGGEATEATVEQRAARREPAGQRPRRRPPQRKAREQGGQAEQEQGDKAQQPAAANRRRKAPAGQAGAQARPEQQQEQAPGPAGGAVAGSGGRKRQRPAAAKAGRAGAEQGTGTRAPPAKRARAGRKEPVAAAAAGPTVPSPPAAAAEAEGPGAGSLADHLAHCAGGGPAAPAAAPAPAWQAARAAVLAAQAEAEEEDYDVEDEGEGPAGPTGDAQQQHEQRQLEQRDGGQGGRPRSEPHGAAPASPAAAAAAATPSASEAAATPAQGGGGESSIGTEEGPAAPAPEERQPEPMAMDTAALKALDALADDVLAQAEAALADSDSD